MVIRQLKEKQYKEFCRGLAQKGEVMPLDASFTVPLAVNGREYAVKLQPERHNKVAVLQALQIDRQDDFPDFMLITNNRLLSSFLEILLVQVIAG